jgi:glycosyltransferase A (GT-A) superfamily protein (DUF2064 family)
MIRTLFIVTSAAALPGAEAEHMQAVFQADLAELAAQLPACTVATVAAPIPPAMLAAALAAGPLAILAGDVPHLPRTRLHDAFTRLADGADLVVGPTDDGSWYLLALAAADAALLAALPPPGAPITPLVTWAQAQHYAVACLPPWYRLATAADLEQFELQLRTMPADTAPHTRILLSQPLHARCVGE